MRRAVIDIGTNTLLLLIVDERGGELVRVLDRCRFGRLGQGLDASSQLHPDAVARSLTICEEYATELRHHQVTAVDVIATQAIREAANAAAFVAPAQAILGHPVTTISGDDEAALAYLTATRSLPALAGQPMVVADVGGGSTEIIVGDGRTMVSATSVPIGAVRMTERHLAGDPPSRAEVTALYAAIAEAIGRDAPALPRSVTLVASAGTASTLAALDLAAPYDADRIHGHHLTAARLMALTDRLLSSSVAERRAMIGMEPPRADVIAAGAAIFAVLAERLAATDVVVSDRGIRWGVAYRRAAT